MTETLQTKLNIKASEMIGNLFVSHPSILTTLHLSNGSTSYSHQDITEGHITYFTGMQIQLVENIESKITPSIVLNYQPLKQISIIVETP